MASERELSELGKSVVDKLCIIFAQHDQAQIQNIVLETDRFWEGCQPTHYELMHVCSEKLAMTPIEEDTTQREASGLSAVQNEVFKELVEMFPNITSDIVRKSVQHPTNQSDIKYTLLQRCINDLLEGRTANESLLDAFSDDLLDYDYEESDENVLSKEDDEDESDDAGQHKLPDRTPKKEETIAKAAADDVTLVKVEDPQDVVITGEGRIPIYEVDDDSEPEKSRLCVKVRWLPKEASVEEVKAYFSRAGPIQKVDLKRHKKNISTKPTKNAKVYFKDEVAAQVAVNLFNHKKFNGQKIRVTLVHKLLTAKPANKTTQHRNLEKPLELGAVQIKQEVGEIEHVGEPTELGAVQIKQEVGEIEHEGELGELGAAKVKEEAPEKDDVTKTADVVNQIQEPGKKDWLTTRTNLKSEQNSNANVPESIDRTVDVQDNVVKVKEEKLDKDSSETVTSATAGPDLVESDSLDSLPSPLKFEIPIHLHKNYSRSDNSVVNSNETVFNTAKTEKDNGMKLAKNADLKTNSILNVSFSDSGVITEDEGKDRNLLVSPIIKTCTDKSQSYLKRPPSILFNAKDESFEKELDDDDEIAAFSKSTYRKNTLSDSDATPSISPVSNDSNELDLPEIKFIRRFRSDDAHTKAEAANTRIGLPSDKPATATSATALWLNNFEENKELNVMTSAWADRSTVGLNAKPTPSVDRTNWREPKSKPSTSTNKLTNEVIETTSVHKSKSQPTLTIESTHKITYSKPTRGTVSRNVNIQPPKILLSLRPDFSDDVFEYMDVTEDPEFTDTSTLPALPSGAEDASVTDQQAKYNNRCRGCRDYFDSTSLAFHQLKCKAQNHREDTVWHSYRSLEQPYLEKSPAKKFILPNHLAKDLYNERHPNRQQGAKNLKSDQSSKGAGASVTKPALETTSAATVDSSQAMQNKSWQLSSTNTDTEKVSRQKPATMKTNEEPNQTIDPKVLKPTRLPFSPQLSKDAPADRLQRNSTAQESLNDTEHLQPSQTAKTNTKEVQAYASYEPLPPIIPAFLLVQPNDTGTKQPPMSPLAKRTHEAEPIKNAPVKQPTPQKSSSGQNAEVKQRNSVVANSVNPPAPQARASESPARANPPANQTRAKLPATLAQANPSTAPTRTYPPATLTRANPPATPTGANRPATPTRANTPAPSARANPPAPPARPPAPLATAPPPPQARAPVPQARAPAPATLARDPLSAHLVTVPPLANETRNIPPAVQGVANPPAHQARANPPAVQDRAVPPANQTNFPAPAHGATVPPAQARGNPPAPQARDPLQAQANPPAAQTRAPASATLARDPPPASQVRANLPAALAAAIPPPVQPQLDPPEPNVASVVEVMAEVLSLFPDVEETYLESLAWQVSGPMAVNNICISLLERQYPKKKKPATVAIETEAVKETINYYIPAVREWHDDTYNRNASAVLMAEFAWFSAGFIRKVLYNMKDCYAPSYRYLAEVWKQIVIQTKSKHDFPYVKPRLSAMTFEVEIDQEISRPDATSSSGTGKDKVMVALLKSRRHVGKSSLHICAALQREMDWVKEKCKELEAEADREVAMELNEEEYELQGQCIECGCCYGEFPFERMVQCCDGHLFCQGCLQQYARESVFGQGKADLKCMTDMCGSSFPKSQLVRALPTEMLARYEDRVTEENLNLADLGDLVKCPHCEFRAFMDKSDKVFRCQNDKCMKETCRYCQVDWEEHFGRPCSEVEKRDETKLRLEYEEKMTKAKVRMCHRCKAQFQKEDGCNKMTCRCGANMCYICREPDINYKHFCPHPRDPGCACTSCKACSLWTNPEEDDNRAVAEIQKAAEEERKAKGYTDEKVIGVPDLQPPPKKKMKV